MAGTPYLRRSPSPLSRLRLGSRETLLSHGTLREVDRGHSYSIGHAEVVLGGDEGFVSWALGEGCDYAITTEAQRILAQGLIYSTY